jgi:hypothetical protein
MKTPRFVRIPRKLSSKKTLIGLAAIAFVGTIGSVWAIQSNTSRNNAARAASIARAQELQDEQAKELERKNAAKQEGEKKATSATEEPATTASQPTKYSTSSDPRSTAYSTTPPAANPASFTTKITRNGQIAAGTLISYNATKGEKTYYGGDLALNTYTVIISKSNPALSSRGITITSPDGHTIGMPSMPWDDTSPYFWLATDASKAKHEGTSFEMFVDGGSNASNGTYQLHISSGRTQQTTDGWRYDAFITIKVVD